MERFIAIGCVAAGLVTTPVAAQAADAVRPVYRAPLGAIYDWTGFYVGGHIGFISTDSDSGFLGGGQAGFNYQVGQWVFGVEGQMSATSIKESAVFVVPGVVARAEGSLDWVSTFAGRAGFAFDQWLVYGKLGAAWAHGSASASVMGPIGGASISVSETISGWMLGVGTEYAFRNNWSAKLEYNMLDFDRGNVHVVKGGLNYRFGFDSRRY